LRSPGRHDDILLLADYFLATSSIPKQREIRGLSESARRKLLEHDWPGNVRELRNVIDRAVILEAGQEISPASLVIERAGGTGARAASQSTGPGDFSLETAERQFILRALQETGWQRTRAAALLGITRATLHAKLKRYDIKPPSQAGQRPPVDGAESASPPSEKLTPLA
jgi:DNA-binding NtrC family response regulator